VHLGFFFKGRIGDYFGARRGAFGFFFKAELGQIWAWLGGFLKAEFTFHGKQAHET